MASTVTIHGLSVPADACAAAVSDALDRVRDVERICTRFDPDSALMVVNRRPDAWHSVPVTLFEAVREVATAPTRTGGRFDPRILCDLVDLGYDRSLPFAEGSLETHAPTTRRAPCGPWNPCFRGGPRPSLRIGAEPIDLGGIGKGLAVRWASERLAVDLDDFFVDAGGDCQCRGPWAGRRWVASRGRGPAGRARSPGGRRTSQRGLRHFGHGRCHQQRPGIRQAMPCCHRRTGQPGGTGLLAVTVIGDDPAEAEVASKTLFLEGARGIAPVAGAAWVARCVRVGSGGVTGETAPFGDRVVWRAP